MNLEILSYEEALRYVPKDKSCGIRIFNSLGQYFPKDLVESNNWVGVKEFSFDDTWPSDWKEYSWVDVSDPYWSGALDITWDEMNKKYPKMTTASLMSYMETRGQPWDRYYSFDKETAENILSYYDGLEGVENFVVHCNRGENRSPAVGIAMNEIYGWGIKGLKKKFPNYRRFIYQTLVDVS